MKNDKLIQQIITAFETVPPPPSWNIVNTTVGDEPFDIAEDFKDRTDRYAIDASFLDFSPKRLSSALSFFSDRAFCYYISAFMIADIQRKLERVDVVFHLINGFTNQYKNEKIGNYGERTWGEYYQYQMSILNSEQKQAINNYLDFKNSISDSEFEIERIAEAKINYWNKL